MTPEEYKRLVAAPKQNKYGAKRTTVDAIKFDSAAKAKRYQELLILERAKAIYNLTRQPVFPIFVCGKLICKYRGDFLYWNNSSCTVEDVKSDGTETATFKIKWKLCQAIFPDFDWRIIKSGGKRGR